MLTNWPVIEQECLREAIPLPITVIQEIPGSGICASVVFVF